MRILSGALSILADALLALLAAAVLFVAVTGGGVFYLGGQRVSMTSSGNPVLFFLVVAALRWWLGRRHPFLGIPRFPVSTLDRRALGFWHRVHDRLPGWASAHGLRVVFVIATVSLAVRLLNAWFHYGFFAGDDVEIHEMTLSSLFGHRWDVWSLRNAFYPVTFVLPAQWLALQLGFTETGALIFAGRAVVAMFAATTMVVLFLIGRREYGAPAAFLAVLFLATSALHARMGSTELPRPVAAFFLVIAFGLSRRGGMLRAAGAGACVGIAGAMRFAEAVFVVPCVLIYLIDRRWRDGLVAALVFGIAWLGILGAADRLYWGSAFHSLSNAVDYSFVKGLSSRGMEPFHWYLTHIPAWSNYLVVALGLYAIRMRAWPVLLWTWVPIVLLSGVNHKEPRYVVPVLPFLALSAGVAFREILTRLRTAYTDRSRGIALALAAGAAAMAVVEAGGFRFPRSETSVDLAIAHRAEWRAEGVAIEQLWRVGGRLYLPDVPTLLEIAPERMPDSAYLDEIAGRQQIGWILLADLPANRPRADALRARGFVEIPDSDPWYRVFRR